MKKLLVILGSIIAVAAITICAIYFFGGDVLGDKKVEDPFNRELLDSSSVFGDYVFEQRVRDFLSLGEGEIDLSALTDITELDLSYHGHSTSVDDKIISIEGLRYFPAIKKLMLNGNALTKLTGIEVCTNLEELYAEECRIYIADAVTKLPKLKILNLCGNGLTELEFLSDMPQLTDLDISQNDTRDVSVFASNTFDNLIKLSVSGIMTKDIDSVYSISSLKILDISSLALSDIDGIQKLTSLEVLYATNNYIMDVSPLAVIITLTTLDLSTNWIRDISPLTKLDKLSKLNLAANSVSDIEPLSDFVALKYVDLSKNKIISYSVLERINFDYINIDGNAAEYISD